MYKTHEQLVRERFLGDVKNHKLEIIRDDCKFSRHIRMKIPDTTNMYYDIVTWRGYLCMTGDMGTYVFSRIDDMFSFFRPHDGHDRKGELYINLQYWAEKLQAVDKNNNYEEFSAEIFKQKVREAGEEHVKEISSEDMPNFMEKLEEEVLSRADDGEYNAREALSDFRWQNEIVFCDTWEWSFKEYSYRYVWACMAIVYAIQKYDESGATAKCHEPAL